MRTTLLCIALMFSILSNAQSTYEKSLGTSATTNRVYSTAILNNESVLIAGITKPSADEQNNLYASLINKNGGLVWAKSYNMQLSLGNVKSATASDNGAYLFAQPINTDGTYGIGAVLLRTDKNGNLLWSKKLTSTNYWRIFPVDVVEDPAGGFAIAYATQKEWNDSAVTSIVHLDDNAAITWQQNISVTQEYGTSYSGFQLIIRFNGGLALAGAYKLNNEFNNFVWPTLTLINVKGKITSSIQVRSVTQSGFNGYEVAYPYSVMELNKKFVFTGLYSNSNTTKKFAVTLGNNTDTTKADLFGNDIFSLQQYAQKKELFGKQIDASTNCYLALDGSLLTVSNGTKRILASKYDSLGRICPPYNFPAGDTTLTHQRFYASNLNYTVVADQLNVTDITAVVTNISDMNTSCSGAATASVRGVVTKDLQLNTTDIKFYPNPVKQAAEISFSLSKMQKVSFKIVSADGKLMQSSTAFFAAGANQKMLQTANLPTGFYMITIGADNKKTTIKFIKE